MKKAIILILITFVVFGVFGFAEAKVRVRESFRKNGTYVAPHYRSSPNRTKFDNWVTRGNYNPYTGKKGTASPFKSYRFRR